MRRLAIVAAVALAACKSSSSGSGGGATLDVGDAAPFSLTSAAFAAGGAIPKTFTCDGDDVSPPLAWSGAPAAAKSFALVVEDPDAPGGTFTHWLLVDVPGATTTLAQASNGVGVAGKNDFGKTGYGGPCPPAGNPHHYLFHLLALDAASLGLAPGASRGDVDHAVAGHVLAKGDLAGTYGR